MPVYDTRYGSGPVAVENSLQLLKASAEPQVCTSSQPACFQFPLSLGVASLQTPAQVPAGFSLQPTVVLSYPDVRLAGLRATHSFTPYAQGGTGPRASMGSTMSGNAGSNASGGSPLGFLPPCLAPSVRAVFGCGDATIELASAVYGWQGPQLSADPVSPSGAVKPVAPFVQVVAASTCGSASDNVHAAFPYPGASLPTSTTGSSSCLIGSVVQTGTPIPVHRTIQIHVLNVTADWADTERLSLVQITGLPDTASLPWFADALVNWLVGPTQTPTQIDDGRNHSATGLSVPQAPASSGTHVAALVPSRVRRVVVVAAADFKPNRGMADRVHEVGSPFEEPLISYSPGISSASVAGREAAAPNLPHLDADTAVQDPFLDALCSLLTVQGVPYTGLLYPAKRLPAYVTAVDDSTPATKVDVGEEEEDEDGPLASATESRLNLKYGEPIPVTAEDCKIVEALCYELSALTGLPFDAGKGCQTSLRYLVRPTAAAGHKQAVRDSMMYL
ncbi:hypothetical protein IWQ60_001341 [Tieghemiomyces parasiticus]|uniref:Uncharacterized protein n=1 Tax=Tieghemiomyces parasiticus TaxID=78921 RepID=A0A9W8AJH9_9FUNG|nr:hypothetical protein IWQ60_001341 [Tieghemiomyces parasiticus]